MEAQEDILWIFGGEKVADLWKNDQIGRSTPVSKPIHRPADIGKR
jgi:hypothetical protein